MGRWTATLDRVGHSKNHLHIIEQLVHLLLVVHEILACRVCVTRYSSHDNASSCYSRTPG